MTHTTRAVCAALRALAVVTLHRFSRDERGEGVISSAIAVLVMAVLGALMWVAFEAMWSSAASRTSVQVDSLGR